MNLERGIVEDWEERKRAEAEEKKRQEEMAGWTPEEKEKRLQALREQQARDMESLRKKQESEYEREEVVLYPERKKPEAPREPTREPSQEEKDAIDKILHPKPETNTRN